MTEQRWKGKTAYPKDVATKRHVDRVQDRLDRRVDLHGEKTQRLLVRMIDAEREIADIRLLLAGITSLLGASEEE